jgi:hypothetical protein
MKYISARGILATITASAGQNGHFSKVGTVYVYLLSNFRFDNNPLIVVIHFFLQVSDDLLLLFWFIWVYFLFIIKYLKLLIIENTVLIFQFYK